MRNSFEQLESRTLFSTTLASSSVSLTSSSSSVSHASATAVKTVTGPTLDLTAGTPFNGAVGFYATPVLDPPLQYFATISWGDGMTTNASLSYGEHNKAFGLIISGVHTYAKHGKYTVTTTLVTAPISSQFKLPTTIVEKIVDKAAVASFPANSDNGLTIDEQAKKKFTAKLGTFTAIAPATGLSAQISWGDGTMSLGTIVSTGIMGLDVIKFKVDGTHAYSLPGKYAIHIVISKISPTAKTNRLVVATIQSTAKVFV